MTAPEKALVFAFIDKRIESEKEEEKKARRSQSQVSKRTPMPRRRR